jgi:hypothetical protein
VALDLRLWKTIPRMTKLSDESVVVNGSRRAQIVVISILAGSENRGLRHIYVLPVHSC